MFYLNLFGSKDPKKNRPKYCTKKMKFSIRDFFSKRGQIRRKVMMIFLITTSESGNLLTIFLVSLKSNQNGFTGFVCSPDPDPDEDPRHSGHSLSDFCKSLTSNLKKRISEKARPPISDLKYRTCVKQKKVPIFCGLTFHNKYIDAGQKCISVSANCI